MAETSLVALADRLGINTMVDLLNQDANDNIDLKAWQKDLYYDQMMLEKIQIGQENYVYLKYAKPYSIPKGHGKWTIRKDFGLTEHTVPLLEGIPPRADKTRKERIEGAYHQYARYAEFSDRVDFKLLDPIVMEMASEYGDVATRSLHRLARKELLSSSFEFYPNNKTSIGELVIGDTAGLALFRLNALKLSRLAVRPIGGVYPVITSEEHMWDLMSDPLIEAFLGTSNGMSHYATGEIPDLFKIKFIPTQMDDFAYGYELGNPGEYVEGESTVKCRGYLAFDNGYEYGNVASSFLNTYVADEYRSASDFGHASRSMEENLPDYSDGAYAENAAFNRLSDGSWIPIRNIWSFTAADLLDYDDDDITLSETVTAYTQVAGNIYYKATYSTSAEDTVTLYFKYTDAAGDDAYEEIGTITQEDNSTHEISKAQLNSILPSAKQLPVHKAIMLGEDALARLSVQNEGDVKMFVKEKGSAGVLDPVNQRQSIGYKINAVGFKLIREEAVSVFYHVPTQAPATATIKADVETIKAG